MDNIKKYEPLLGTWHIESPIGEGSFGKVYQICRKELGKTYYSAIKIIALPQDHSEIQRLESKGLDRTAIHGFYRSLISNIASEIDLMRQITKHSHTNGDPKSSNDSHILSFEDYKIIENPYEIGWDILIRMELLQPLSYYIHKKPLSRAEVVKLGIHMCRALELFHHNTLIHKNIKPSNIFITRHGTFKLGDFGIDRQLRRTIFGVSKKRSYAAMAPEVFKSEPCDTSTDTYSLGILMYSLLNQNRVPFLPGSPQAIMPKDHKNAFMRRINGEPIPALVGVNTKLNALLLKACAYNRTDRFCTPAEMRKTLETLAAATAPLKFSPQTVSPGSHPYFMGRQPLPDSDSQTVHTVSETRTPTERAVSLPRTPVERAASLPRAAPAAPHTPISYTKPVTHPEPSTHTEPIPRRPTTHTESAIQSESAVHRSHKNAAPSCPPPQHPKSEKKGWLSSFISRKQRPLMIGLASAIVLITLAVVLVSSLTVKYGININGQTDIILSDHKEAQAVLDDLKAYYTDLASSAAIDISSVTYEETVEVAKARAPASKIKDKNEALQALIKGQDHTQTIEYTVTQGETIQEIAQKYNITTEAIIAENEDLAITVDTLPQDPLTEGATIKLAVAQPYLHVVIEGSFNITEEIDIEIHTEKKDTLLQNTAKVQQEGEKGFRDAIYTIVLKNNVPVEKTILEETIHKEMVPKIVFEGSRPPRPGADSEQLKYIIHRESTGNVKATNGPYKGLGQLMDRYYQTYVGMSYEETLQQPDPYAVQVDAMLGYIYARYGSIEAAYNHWVQNHWY